MNVKSIWIKYATCHCFRRGEYSSRLPSVIACSLTPCSDRIIPSPFTKEYRAHSTLSGIRHFLECPSQGLTYAKINLDFPLSILGLHTTRSGNGSGPGGSWCDFVCRLQEEWGVFVMTSMLIEGRVEFNSVWAHLSVVAVISLRHWKSWQRSKSPSSPFLGTANHVLPGPLLSNPNWPVAVVYFFPPSVCCCWISQHYLQNTDRSLLERKQYNCNWFL